MTTKPFIIYKSSAGSGKTYTLAMEYLKLALEHPFAFKQILAVTFTNKATREMKERILEVLERLTTAVDPTEKMDKRLLEHLSLSEGELKRRAKEVLTAILHHYGDFSVSTIDSFFQRVVRAFAWEMGLPAKFDIELDQDAVLDRLVDRLMVKVVEEKSLRRWLIEFAEEKIREGRSWDVRWDINKLGKQIFQEDFKKHHHTVAEFLTNPDNIRGFRAGIFTQREQIRQKVLKIKQDAAKLVAQVGLSWEDFKGGTRSPMLFFERLDRGRDLFPNISNSLLRWVDNPDEWCSKNGRVDLIQQAYDAGLNDLLKEALGMVVQWNTLEEVRKNFYVFGIFSHLLEELQNLKEEENIMLVSDANDFLKKITANTDAPFIYEKVGNQFKNYLIDEFQDTSGFQWASLYPLLDNSLAAGNTSLVVGDVKQSIYRWRGGDLTLLLREVERQIGAERVQLEDLDTNYRSLPNLVRFNNVLFEQLTSQMMIAAGGKYGVKGEYLSVIRTAYEQVRQKVAPHKQVSDFQGKVKIDFLKAEEGEKVKDLAAARLPEMVRALQDQGYALKDIAILVRKNQEAQEVAETMMEYGMAHPDDGYRYDVLSDEAMFLYKATSVKALLAALNYLAFPDDDVAFRTMWYHKEVMKGATARHELFDYAAIMENSKTDFQDKKARLLQLPLFELVEELIEMLGFNVLGLERAYLSGFREAVIDYGSKNKSDIVGFLDWWELRKEKRTVKIPDSHDAMRVLTIHKSKGLQFKVILIPFMDWGIVQTGDVIWSGYRGDGGGEVIVPLSFSSALSQTTFDDHYQLEVMMAYLDSLNMIYVALTRAEEVLWAMGESHSPKSLGSPNRLSYLVQQAVVAANGLDNEADLGISYNSDEEIIEIGNWPEGKITSEIYPSPPGLAWSYRNWSSLLRVKKQVGEQPEEIAAFQKKRNFGVLIHKILAQMNRLDELEGLLQEAYFEGKLDGEELAEVKRLFERLIAESPIRDWYADGVRALTEQGILLPGGAVKRPDRIIIKEGQAILIDFKTGKEKGFHETQLREYMALVGEMTQKPTEAFLVYIESGKIRQVYAAVRN